AVVVVVGMGRMPVVVVVRRAVGGGDVGAVRAARSGPTITMTSAPRVSATGGGLAMGCTAVSAKARTLATSLASASWPGAYCTLELSTGLAVLVGESTL